MVHLNKVGEIRYLVFWFLLDLAECRILKNPGPLWKQHSPYYVLKVTFSERKRTCFSLSSKWTPRVLSVYHKLELSGELSVKSVFSKANRRSHKWDSLRQNKKKKKNLEAWKVPVHVSVSKTNKYFRNCCQRWKCLKTCMFIRVWIIFILMTSANNV